VAQRDADAAPARARINVDRDAAAACGVPRRASQNHHAAAVERIDADGKLASRWRESGDAACLARQGSRL